MPEDVVRAMVKHVKQEARSNLPAVCSMLINCAIQMPAKMPLYCLIVGLVNVDESSIAANLLNQVSAELNDALNDPASYRKARLLLRFLTALAVPGVVQPLSAVAALKSVVDAAANVAASAPVSDEDGRTWQPYADHLVYMALTAVPFGGSEVGEGAGDALAELIAAAESYLEKRPRSSQPGLRPFAASIKEDDPIAETDNGGASLLVETVQAVKEAVDAKAWQLIGIPRVHLDLEATLAGAGTSYPVDPPHVPASPPVETPEGASDTLVGALVLAAFPPRGTIRFLEPRHTLEDRLLIERLVAEDYVIDTIAWFEGDRVACAKQLAHNLPLPYTFEPLVCEVIFGQMLRLPNPEFKPIMYSTLMVELCKLLKMFPRAMSACVRECFSRMNVMDPALRERLAEWLAYHLSNFEYVWPWSKWAHVLEAPSYDGQQRFCVAVMNRMVRLSYWDRVHAVVPEEFRVLLPPKPEVEALPEAETTGEDAQDPEGAWAAAALLKVRSKASAEDLDEWIASSDLETKLGGKIGVLRMLARCLLVAGAKSYTHMIIALERYYGPLAILVESTGLEGQVALVAVAAKTWALNPQRTVMAVDRLMTLRLVSAEAIVTWIFGPDGVRNIQDQSRSGMAWEMLRKAVRKTIARVDDASDDFAAAKAAADAAMALDTEDDEVKAVSEKESDLKEATLQQQGAMVQVLREFAQALGEGGFAAAEEGDRGEGEMMDASSSEHSILREYMIVSLRSFLREYHIQAAQLEERIQQEIMPMATEEVQEILKVQLRM